MPIRWPLLLACSCLMFAGCGDLDWGTATGTAFLDGTPMQNGLVSFEPVGGGATAYAQITGNGTFKVMTGSKEGLKVGAYVVTVIDQTLPEYGGVAEILSPLKYATVATSDLKATITPGINRLEFKLTK